MFLYPTTFFLSLIILLLFYYKRCFKYWENLNIPNPKPSFPFGNLNLTKELCNNLSKIYFEMKNKGHDYCGYYMFTLPFFMPINLTLFKHILITDFNCFNDRGFYIDEENDAMSANIITMSGDSWRRMRDKMSPAWTAGKVKLMFPLMFKCTDELNNVIEDKITKGEYINVPDIAKRYAIDVICSCAFGIDGRSLKDINSEILRYGKMINDESLSSKLRLSMGLLAPAVSKLIKVKLFNPKITDFFQKIVYEIIEYRDKQNIEPQDLLNALIRLKNENKNKINNEQIAAECFLFFLAGMETASSAINFLWYVIAKYQDIQQRIRQEIVNTLQKFDNKFSYDAIKEMQYLEHVFQESMRMYPPVHMLNRKSTKSFTIPNSDVNIEKGTSIILSVFAIHRDPEYYPNPDTFDPDRFKDETNNSRPSHAYIPFGDGPRICLGARFAMVEVKLFMAYLLLKYKFKVHPSTGEVKLCSSANILETKNPILLSAERL